MHAANCNVALLPLPERLSDASASLDETFGEGDLTHWEIVWGLRRRYEFGLIEHDPCALWATVADTGRFLDWYREQVDKHPEAYPAQIASRALRRVYLEYCCMHTVRPREDALVRIEIGVLTRPENRAPKPALPPQQAAHEFAKALRAAGKFGEYTPQQLALAFKAFCAAQNRRETPWNSLRIALKAIPGVRSDQLTGKKLAGMRHRPTVWVIGPDKSEGLRRAA